MDTNQIHTPERLEGETQEQYCARQHMSKRLAERTTLVWNNGTYFRPDSPSPQRGKGSRGPSRAQRRGAKS